MSYIGRIRFRSVSCILLGGVLMTTLSSFGLAQQPLYSGYNIPAVKTGDAPTKAAGETSTAASLEEMLSTIKRLEMRVKELENKLDKGATDATPSVVAAKTVKEEAVKDETVKPVATKQEEKKNPVFAFFQNTEISGFVDAYYGYNFNRPTGDAQLRNFDTKHNQFGFNLAEFALEKKVNPDSRLGFRMDLNFGPTTDIVHSFEPGSSETFKHIQQGYISYLVPAGKGLQVDAGKFVTPLGAEVIETKDNWNYSRSLLFALAIPYYHFGVRASYPVHDKFTLTGYAVNGWNNVVDNNVAKTYGVQAVIKPTANLTLTQGYFAGPEQPGNDHDWRHVSDTIVTYTVNPKLSLMANYDYGKDRVGDTSVHWQGIAAYAKIQANDWLAFSPRFEWYDDHDGFSTGAVQKVKDFTLTSEQKINGGLLTRFEYRRDFSDMPYFLKRDGRLVKAQSTLAFGFIYAFSSKSDQ